MTSKFTLQALALAGILAVSGLPAVAADMTPAAPAPGVATGSTANADAKALPSTSAAKDVAKDSKAKNLAKNSKALKSEQKTAKTAPAASATVSGAAASSVQH